MWQKGKKNKKRGERKAGCYVKGKKVSQEEGGIMVNGRSGLLGWLLGKTPGVEVERLEKVGRNSPKGKEDFSKAT